MRRRNFLSATLAGTASALAAGPRAACGRGPVSPKVQARRLATQREDLEVSIQYTKKLLSI